MVSSASLHHIRLFYAAYFGAMGLVLPFFPVYLAARNLDVSIIGILTGLLALARMLSPPIAGVLLDKRQDSSPFIVSACIAAALFALLMAWLDQAWWLAVLVLGFGMLWSAVLPLTDGLSVAVSEAALVDYGRLRVWGSIGFVIATLAGGAWLAGENMLQFPYWLCALLIFTAIAAWGFPTDIGREAQKGIYNVGDRDALLMLLLASFVMQASHGAYYGFFSLYLLDLGYQGWQVGIFWVLGVVAEIVLMWTFSRPLQQSAPAWVLGACLMLASVRWAGIAMTHAWWLLAGLQLLHAASFAAFHINAVTWVRRLAPMRRHAAAQGWYSAVGFGLGTTLGIMACGWISEHFGYASAFMVCAVVALGGVLAVWRLPRQV